jgi:hypothetical protein
MKQRFYNKLFRTYDAYGWSCKERDVSTHINGALLADYEKGPSYNLVNFTFNPTMAGHVERFSYWYAMDITTEYRSDTLFRGSSFEPYEGVPALLFGRMDSSHARVYSLLRGGINYHYRYLDIEAGVDRFRQGPCIYHPLTFSANAPPATYFRARLDLWKTNYSHSIVELNSQRGKGKYLYTHRWRFPGWKNRFYFGVGEVLVHGSVTDQQPPCADTMDCADTPADTNSVAEQLMGTRQQWQWRYMIPFVPYAVAQQVYGDRGNTLIFMDMSLRFPDTWRWYAEFLIDDINVGWPLFSDDFGDKWALTLGTQHYFTAFTHDFSLDVEYSRIEPWVYTHYYGGSHRFTHFGKILGSPLGPNSEALTVALHHYLYRSLRLTLSFDNVRKNKSVRGGSILDVFQGGRDEDEYRDPEIKRFLGKTTVRHTTVKFRMQYMLRQRYSFFAACGYNDTSETPGDFFLNIGGRLWY